MPCLRASLVGYLMVRLLLAARPERVCTAAGSQWSPPTRLVGSWTDLPESPAQVFSAQLRGPDDSRVESPDIVVVLKQNPKPAGRPIGGAMLSQPTSCWL
jgi:hypothetical protein